MVKREVILTDDGNKDSMQDYGKVVMIIYNSKVE